MKADYFPIPAPNQCPNDDLACIASLLRTVDARLEHGSQPGLTAGSAADLLTLVGIALDMTRPIITFLDDLDGTSPAYRENRRLAILESFGRASS